MKAEITTSPEKGFKPFTVSITAETVQDARLLFHLFDHSNLRRLLLLKTEHDTDDYSKDFSTDLDPACENEVWEQISEIIRSQGYKI